MVTLRAPTLTAADVMTRRLVTLQATEDIYAAVQTLLRHRISGAPVCEGRRLVGMLSEHDGLKLIGGSGYTALFEDGGPVWRYMSQIRYTVTPDIALPELALLFVEKRIRRVPVVEDEALVGQVSRRDVLHAIVELRRAAQASRYPDYRRPA